MISKIKENFKKSRIKRVQIREYLEALPTAYDEKVISWEAPERIKHKRGKFWKIFMSAAFISAATIAFVHNQWTFSMAIIAFAIVYYLINKEHTKDVEVSISNIGIKVGKRKYPFSKIKAFWIIYEPPLVKTLNIKVHNDLSGDISIQLNEQDPSEIREFLIERIPELEGKSEALSDILVRLFKL